MRKKVTTLTALLSRCATKDFIESVGHITIFNDFFYQVSFSVSHYLLHIMEAIQKPSILGSDFFEAISRPTKLYPFT